jgi:hypothetical protein
VESLLLSVHVVAGILFVGPVAAVTSLFPRFVRADAGSAAVARQLHRITRGYGVLALVVPAAGLVLAAVQGRFGEIWVTVAMVLTAVAGGLLALRIAPLQAELLQAMSLRAEPQQAALLRAEPQQAAPLPTVRAHEEPARPLRTMRALVGVFNLLWVAVVVLMIVRPGAAAA